MDKTFGPRELGTFLGFNERPQADAYQLMLLGKAQLGYLETPLAITVALSVRECDGFQI